MRLVTKLLLLNCLLVSLAWPQAQPADRKPAEPAAPSAEDAARAAKFFAAQQRLHASDARIKRAADTVRTVRENARAKLAAGAALRREAPAKNAVERQTRAQAREEEIDAEVEAETAQIALEEAVLEQILKDEPDLAGLVAAQRQELGVRKKMLALRANNGGRLETDPEVLLKRQPPPGDATPAAK